jgi:hypothetical protein
MSPRRNPPVDDASEDTKTSIFDPQRPREHSSLHAISMKTPPAMAPQDERSVTPAVPRPNLSARADVQPPPNLGYLAPPADPHRNRSRRGRDVVVVATLSLLVASIIALVIWFAAR